MIDQDIKLIKTVGEDLHALFQIQLDKEANHLAAFTSMDPSDKATYMEKYSRLISEPTINNMTIWRNNSIVGSIAKYVMDDEAEITYWIDRKFWGHGIATTALKMFLESELVRPIKGRVAFDNYGSQRVLEKCGFIRTGKDKGFANARQIEIEEFIYTLSEPC